MTRFIIIYSILLLTGIAQTTAQTDTCNCLANLNQTISKTEANYAGYPAKVNRSYAALVRQLRQRSTGITTPKPCYYILKDYVRFFKDKHFIISYNAGKDFDSIVVPIKQPIEGTWRNADSTTLITIKKLANGSLQALKLQSTTDSFPPGFVYFTLVPNGQQYIAKTYDAFVSTDFPAKQTGNLLHIWNHAVWGKSTMTETERAELALWKGSGGGFTFKTLSREVAYLKIPSFYNNDHIVQALVNASDSSIRQTKYLIVDPRGNGGGTTGWVSLFPYLMTNPIIQKPALLRVTPDNVKYQLQGLEYFVQNPIPDDYKKYFPDSTLAKYKKAYEELPVTKQAFYPIPSVNCPLDSVTKKPEKVAVIVDNFCGSSTEYFLSLVSQSKKATTYGTRTLGMMDYEGMSVPTPLPYNKFILTIPVSQSHWTGSKPIDQTGFTPQVVLSQPEEQWIDLVIEDLKKR